MNSNQYQQNYQFQIPNYQPQQREEGQTIDFEKIGDDLFASATLYFRQNDPNCVRILQFLSKNPDISRKILKIDYDKLIQNGKRVEGLRGFPTLVDNERSQVYQGNRIFQWFENKSKEDLSSFDFESSLQGSRFDNNSSVKDTGFSSFFEQKNATFTLADLNNPEQTKTSFRGDVKNLSQSRDNDLEYYKQKQSASKYIEPEYAQQSKLTREEYERSMRQRNQDQKSYYENQVRIQSQFQQPKYSQRQDDFNSQFGNISSGDDIEHLMAQRDAQLKQYQHDQIQQQSSNSPFKQQYQQQLQQQPYGAQQQRPQQHQYQQQQRQQQYY